MALNKMTFGTHSQLDEVLKNTKQEAKERKVKRVQVELDEQLHADFKVACIKNNTNFSAVVTGLIKQWMKKHA
ncbi:plasmid partition protein ParG [Edwardsiella tarda]|uniref:plasmid partition protein ParG n=1 Tax=Edwardsiella tarda TaxID=636 RepID=UPI0002D7829A|nr:plasmid partition protein ParG [Edwardsiella tarda]